MAIYVPPTGETDPKKQNQSLQLIGGILTTAVTNIATNTASIAAHEAAWTAYTPAITASTGTFTAVAATGRYKQIGKTVFVNMSIVITTNGTAASAIVATLPVTAFNGGFGTFAGKDISVTGEAAAGILTSTTTAGIQKYNGTYLGGDGYRLIVSGTYEAA